MQRKRFKRFLTGTISILLLASLIGVTQRQAIHDWLKLYGYQPPASVVQLSNDITLTDKARKVFYVNHPAIEDSQTFNTACKNRDQHTSVLGCYHPVDHGIFVFHVADQRLAGVDQVTAAHEMLHAAYDRLSTGDRKRVDAMLQDFYANGLQDDRIKSIIAVYQKTEPNDVVNEMHSIFGTECSQLPPDLEAYYTQYFVNRTKVAKYASDYQDEFSSRQTLVSDYDTRLKTMKQQLDDSIAELASEEAEISSLKAQMDRETNANDIDAYNADVPVYNAKIDTYNALVVSTKSLMSIYNQTVVTRNQLALQVNDLAHSIDSTFQPITK
jgi:hypothetical protein